ncbi:hypothetical protein [Bifidobacterium oedipodis]|uniref:Uncharacterized protein n=1 Tax=Bifidobacterium oedipodis TaxID=2675322 RepID=A0A7Y0HTA0_9BIFI|nr:hypothetical protein [Bifidobacterium sp. DSM 109957]NMM93902.1 hypothetical protein [Bifidobacterium sp. DSM 109957]
MQQAEPTKPGAYRAANGAILMCTPNKAAAKVKTWHYPDDRGNYWAADWAYLLQRYPQFFPLTPLRE